MPRYVALLGGINVGGHRVAMSDLRALFESLGFASVSTFIASGNVVFDTAACDAPRLQTRIERRLGEALGYRVPASIRSSRRRCRTGHGAHRNRTCSGRASR
jgi:uncharacterized protein (DUF1697 family)